MSEYTETETEVVDAEESNSDKQSAAPEGYTAVTATAKLKETKEKVEATFYYDFAASALDAIEKWGDKIVHDCFIRASKIDAQARMRSLLEAGKNPEEVAENMSTSWYPGAKNLTSKDDMIAVFGKLSEEERKELLAKLATL